MIDFTLHAYRRYLLAISRAYPVILRFDEFFQLPVLPSAYCLIRHDVDRKPGHALAMAALELSLGIRSTYYFRVKQHTLKPKIIRRIHRMGHEIGYHYESLSDVKGDMDAALADFHRNLEKLRRIAPVRTVSMHGRPLSPVDDRDLWRDRIHRRFLKERLNILGEIYLDIDYQDILYVSDTGRNWTTNRANRRDRVKSDCAIDFPNGKVLIAYLSNQPHPRLVFQVHPERWATTVVDYGIQWLADGAINRIKAVL
jgi:hypothetical protein